MAKKKNKGKTRIEVLRVLEYTKKHEKSPLLVVNCENINPSDGAMFSEIKNLLNGLERLPVPVIFLINSTQDSLVDALRKHNCARFMAVCPTKDFKEQIYKAANFYLGLTSTKNDMEDLALACARGAVPITHAAIKGLKDYDPISENGNSFTFNNINAWEIFMAITRAMETFRFPYDWQNIIKETQRLRVAREAQLV